MSIEVQNISMKKPCASDVLLPSRVRALMPPGMTACETPAAAMAATNCTMNNITERYQLNAPQRKRPSVTAGLKRPPETRKKTHALTAREKLVVAVMVSRCFFGL